MIETTVGELKRYDKIRSSVKSSVDHTVSSISPDSRDTALKQVYVMGWERPMFVTTEETKVWAVSMVREVEVACLALTHEGDKPPTMLHDLAKGRKPRGIFCGDCAAAADDAAGF